VIWCDCALVVHSGSSVVPLVRICGGNGRRFKENEVIECEFHN